MDILSKLGINYTLFYQFGIFVVAYFIISRLLFKPYLNAYNKRVAATSGEQEAAEKLNEASRDLHIQYEKKAREVNSKIQSYFEQAQKEAQAVQASTIDKARKESEALVETARQNIDKEVQKVRGNINSLVPELSHEIERKILNRELT